MNTSKQVNMMIVLLFLSFVIFGGYMVNEAKRQTTARGEVTERVATRGARLFVNNCRGCHGMDGKGAEEGAIAPPIHTNAFLILGADNAQGLPATPAGEAKQIRDFLFTTISCGRTGTYMPTWSQKFGGPLSETQVNQIVTMITNGRWDLVEEIGTELDHETGATKDTIVVKDPATLSQNGNNCGQYGGDLAKAIRARDPLNPDAAKAAAAAPAVPTQTPGAAVAGAPTVKVSLADFSLKVDVATAKAGDVNFNVANTGAAPHEFFIVKTDLAPDGLPVKAGAVDESASGVTPIGRTPQIGGGQSKEASFKLEPGKYVLICNIPAHYGLGMRAAFTVQ